MEASLRKRLEEKFKANSLGVSPCLARLLLSTDVVNLRSGVQLLTRHASRWPDGEIKARWAVAAVLMIGQWLRGFLAGTEAL